jgi:hypothetical protein
MRPGPGWRGRLLQGGQLPGGGRAGDPGGLGQLGGGGAGSGRQRGHDGRCPAGGRRCGGRAGPAVRRRVRGAVRRAAGGRGSGAGGGLRASGHLGYSYRHIPGRHF